VMTRDVFIILKVCKIIDYLLKCTGVDGEYVSPAFLLLNQTRRSISNCACNYMFPRCPDKAIMGRHFTQYSTQKWYTHLLLPQRARIAVHTFRFQPVGSSDYRRTKYWNTVEHTPPQPGGLAGRLPGSRRRYWTPVGR
jgi:hypothetical protein